MQQISQIEEPQENSLVTIPVGVPPGPILPPPRPDLKVLFLHIPKTGGTSFDKQLRIMQKESDKTRCFTYSRVPQMKHFDWSVVRHMQQEADYTVVTILRNPIDRAISHFHYIKHQSWVCKKPIVLNVYDI